jgi:hypothetical protein
METQFKKLRAGNPQPTILSEWAIDEFKEIIMKTYN